MSSAFAIVTGLLLAFQLNAPQAVRIPDPPKEHPRLYLSGEDVKELKSRVESKKGQQIIRALEKAGRDRTPEEEQAETDHGFRYYFKMRGVTSRAQLHALRYLVYHDKEEARTAISEMLDTLKKTNYGTTFDLSRASGAMLMVGAIVYDWCYDQMTAQEKQAYVQEFIRIAGTMECRYPPKRNEALAGHGSEWMILRDMLSAGIAIYDEYPDMFNYVRETLEEDYIPIRNYIYAGGNQHQGTSYATVRLSNDLISMWILDRMGARNLYTDGMRDVLYDFIYRRRPDGKVIPAGDVNHVRKSFDSYALPAFLAAAYWKDEYLAYEWQRKPSVEPHCLIFRLLWEDFDLVGKAPDSLPLTRFSGTPFGWMIARTGWNDDAVIAEMKINEQFAGNHQHLDGGSFQLYYKGPLAIDSGIYQSVQGGYNSPNNKNYTKRTIAHNSLLIYDPDEVFECFNYGGADKTQTAANDGGQRMPGIGWDTCRSLEQLLSEEYTVGKTLAHGFGPDREKPVYSYLKGDITQAYSKKAQEVQRSFVFLNLGKTDIPGAMIIYDRVTSSEPSLRKSWLLHSIEEPEIKGGCFTVRRTKNGDTGMLYGRNLLPQNAEIIKIGGPGKEFWVDGQNYPADPQPNRPDEAGERGAWRIEISPSAQETHTPFLNVLQVADGNCQSFLNVQELATEKICGALVGGYAVLFSKSGQPLKSDITLSIPRCEASHAQVLFTDLAPGQWQISRCGKKVAKGTVREDGTWWLKLKPGEYTVKMIQ